MPEPARPAAGPAIVVTDSAAVVRHLEALEAKLHGIRQQQETLDGRRDLAGKDVSQWPRHERFGKLKSSSSHRFLDREPAALETNCEADIQQLDDRVFQIQEKLKEADQQRDIVVHVLATAVDEALGLLSRVSRMSKLPDSLPQAGKQFLKIETKASENPSERCTYIGELIDEVLERGEVGDGLQLVQKAVRRVARRIAASVQRRSQTVAVRPATAFHRAMLASAAALGAPSGWPAKEESTRRLSESALSFVTAELRRQCTSLIEERRRIPEEVLPRVAMAELLQSL